MAREKNQAAARKSSAEEASDPHEFDLGGFIPYLLMRISGRLGKNLATALKQMDLTPAHWRILATLADRDGRTLTELSVYTTVDHSTLSRTVDRLETDGQVVRRQTGGDGRTVSIFITKHGRESFRRILPVAMAQYEWAIRELGEDEIGQLRKILMKMLSAIRVSPYP